MNKTQKSWINVCLPGRDLFSFRIRTRKVTVGGEWKRKHSVKLRWIEAKVSQSVKVVAGKLLVLVVFLAEKRETRLVDELVAKD